MASVPTSSPETDSLVKRLAGPSTGKAGLAKDQTEINRIIAEASKGSKYYENEKRKDKELTEKISNILKIRDDLVKNANIQKVEHTMDILLAQIEQCRDLSQIIVHVDMDAFFANVEVLHNPSLAGKPFGVGHGVLSTASYEARKYGVRSGMATHIAKKLCPELIVVSISFHRYSEMSKKAFDIMRRYDPTLCPAGCDEGYLNITDYCADHGITPVDCVNEMRQKIHEETSLTASAGIAPNLMLAKICSDRNKPNGQFDLPFEAQAIIGFMHDLPIRKIPGIGRVSERLLDSIGVKTCSDIYTHRATLSLLDKQFGVEHLLHKYLGIASNVVAPHQRDERKSIGAERTFHSLSAKEKILDKLDEIATELSEEMEEKQWTAKTITLKYKLDTYQVFTRAKTTDRWVSKKEDLYNIGKELLLKELPITIRLLGLRATKLKDLKEDGSAGIKRFFGAQPDTPRKKSRLDAATAAEDYDFELPISDFHDITSADDGPLDLPETLDQHRVDPLDEDLDTPPSSSQICPICNKVLVTDNDGLNAHVDFCLSKSAIQAAQTEASGSSTLAKLSTDKPKSSSYTSKLSEKPSSSRSITFWTKPLSGKK